MFLAHSACVADSWLPETVFGSRLLTAIDAGKDVTVELR